MALHYTIVFGLLVTEMVLMTLFLLPLPYSFRKGLTRWLAESSAAERLHYYLKIICIFVLVLFVDALNRSIRLHHDLHDPGQTQSPFAGSGGHGLEARVDATAHSRMFYAQRNVYLCGFTLFLTLALYRLQDVFLQWVTAEEKLQEARRHTAKQSGDQNKASQRYETAEAEVIRLQARVSELEEAHIKYKDISHQMDNQNKAYLELTDRYAELERKHALRSGDHGRKDD
ncbi:endoplasmic reticulum protein [Piptocephalis cylindrospora]|uniref:Endoplasmic reticulum transmembrane protein n=1 Tax=Piptocephalis cylindrospora TaxID=1907219 RepID=A0A4P9Y9C8_9FUNG|nr:endoplasmic reticulum protein [Piptocephalis cylindrospora]|eukprot:RKP15021.1 endoplasmic reticulum protein [Piptocephalis cylindrospora]